MTQENRDILKHDLENLTKSSSNIEADDVSKIIKYDDVSDLLDKYFNEYTDPVTANSYNKGDIFSLNDEFDFFKFLKSLCTIFEDNVVSNKLSVQEKIQTRQLFNIINSCVDMLKTIDIKKDDISVVITLIKHCTSAYNKYNK